MRDIHVAPAGHGASKQRSCSTAGIFNKLEYVYVCTFWLKEYWRYSAFTRCCNYDVVRRNVHSRKDTVANRFYPAASIKCCIRKTNAQTALLQPTHLNLNFKSISFYLYFANVDTVPDWNSVVNLYKCIWRSIAIGPVVDGKSKASWSWRSHVLHSITTMPYTSMYMYACSCKCMCVHSSTCITGLSRLNTIMHTKFTSKG